MRFMVRGLVGLALIALTFGSVGFGAFKLYSAISAEESARQRPASERTYTVNAGVLTPQSITPVTTAYGTVVSWRTLQLRASSEGRLVEVAGKFRDGAAVGEGELLLRIDPANAEFQYLDAEAALADALAQKAEAEEAVVGAEQELEAARRQLELRKQALGRQLQLQGRGYSTEALVETEQLAVASLEQSLSNRLQAVISARRLIDRTELSVQRAELALEDAERVLQETTLTAPFYGYLAEVDATLGRRVTSSETLAQLIDPAALEVRFSLSTSEFSRLLDDSGNLIEAPVAVKLQLGGRSVEIPGHVDRVAATVSDGEAGRTLFAHLDIEQGTVLRPGDFVTVEIQEPELTGVAVLPAAAITESGRLLVIGEDDRLQEIETTVLRRQGSDVVLSSVPFGTTFVRERLPQLGPGLKVVPRLETPPSSGPASDAPATAQAPARPVADAETGPGRGDLVALEPERRDALLRKLNDSDLPDRRKDRIETLLNKPMVPRHVVDGLEQNRDRQG